MISLFVVYLMIKFVEYLINVIYLNGLFNLFE